MFIGGGFKSPRRNLLNENFNIYFMLKSIEYNEMVNFTSQVLLF